MQTRVTCCVVFFVVAALCGRLCGQTYMIDVSGELFTADLDSGLATSIVTDLGTGSWTGLTGVPDETDVLYATQNPSLRLLDDPQFSRIARINLNTGDATLLPLFGEELGLDEVFSTAIAVSPLAPMTAVLAGNDRGFPPELYLWKVDLESGRVTEAAREIAGASRIEALTFSPDGEQLLGTNQQGQLVEIDIDAATVNLIGDPQLSNFLTGLAFDPDSETLFGIEASSRDRLISLNAETGQLTGVFSPFGNRGPDGLAIIDAANALDCNGDGAVSFDDLTCANQSDITESLLAELGLLAGDLDGMNGVSFQDFLILSFNFGTETEDYTKGDINGDGLVGFPDFLALSTNFRVDSQAFPVPEPGGSYAWWGLFFCLAGIRRNRPRLAASLLASA